MPFISKISVPAISTSIRPPSVISIKEVPFLILKSLTSKSAPSCGDVSPTKSVVTFPTAVVTNAVVATLVELSDAPCVVATTPSAIVTPACSIPDPVDKPLVAL